MQPHLPWFCQGDILRSVPILKVVLDPSGRPAAGVSVGPALLLTHGCVLDKAARSGQPTVERLHFTPLVAVSEQDSNRQTVLRAGGLTPYEVMYLGVCGEYGESFVALSETFAVPSRYFQPTLAPWEAHDAAQLGERYLTPGRNGERVGRLDDSQLAMLLDKINAFWTRRLPKSGSSGI